jgi:hypothetical protein
LKKPSEIKPSQLTRVGYAYQDLMCIRMLINWFHEPQKYQWMSIEESNLDHIKSLDDVICLNANGEYELYQVKFTIDSERDDLSLDFDWLLKKKPKGTSLVEKWSNDLQKFSKKNTISVAKLITNRKPDVVLSGCLDRNKINYHLIPDDIKEKILTQIGDESKAIFFFENLILEHSQPEIDDLQSKLQDSIVPDHANNEGWFQLLKSVERWASRKNEPSPGGRILLEHIYEILSLGTKRTISQFFEIPEGYKPPLEEFHQKILEVTTKPGSSVISGLPGMGKSTYLSFLTDQLIEQNTPVIRHHYYLSSHFVGDRIAFNNAAQSLQSQIKSLYPIDFDSDKLDPQHLESWIIKAANKTAETGQILVIIIDGLDHVYRERSDISQLEHLVNRISPLQDKVCLLYGTQPVSDEYLPNALLRSAPRDRAWIDIPPMGLDAIKKRIDFLVSIEEIDVIGKDDYQKHEIVEISRVLLEISQGYPLHIIYSLNSLKLTGNKISKYYVERLPTCPEGDIQTYYENLWVSLSESAKEILLLIANADFLWPDETHLGYCFDDSLSFRNSFAEIQHLIEKRLSGITPFHNSLFVYLQQKDEFSKSKERLNQKSKVWIEQHAPEYWKWGWEWIIEANLGNIYPLLHGINRPWLITSLCKAYPIEHIEHIINIAENIALESSLYPELLRLRMLKMRLINGSEFQVQDFSTFLDCSLSLSSDNFGLIWRADNLRIIPENEILIVAKHFQGKNEKIINSCRKEIYRRLRFYARLEDHNHNETINSLIDDYLQVLVSYDTPDVNQINEFYERLTNKSSNFIRIIELLVQYGHRHLLLDLSVFDIPEDIYPRIIDEVVLAASIEGLSLEKEFQRLSASNSTLGLLHLFLNGKSVEPKELVELDKPNDHETATYDYFYRHFFNTTTYQLSNTGHIDEPELTEPTSIEIFIDNAWLTFQYASYTFISKFKAGETYKVSDLFKSFAILELPKQHQMDYQLSFVLFNLKKSLAKIAIHLYILCNSTDDFTSVDIDDFLEAMESPWWDSRVFFDVAAENSIFTFPQAITSVEFNKLFEAELHRREDTSSLTNDSLELGILAFQHGLHDTANQFLERSALNMIGYGWRKDITFHEVFEVIEECSNVNIPQVPDWLKRVAAFTTDVFDFSEKEINHIPSWFTRLLAKHSPERLVDEFDYHLSEESWHRADNILENIIKEFPLSTKPEHAFLRCITTYDALKALQERAEDSATLKSIYDEQCKAIGGMPPAPKERYPAEEEEKAEHFDVNTIQPDNLVKLKSALHSVSYKIREQFIADWISHWTDQGHETIILDSFNSYYEQGNSDYELNNCLHELFLLSKKVEGKKKAYIWAVRDIKLNNCWSPYYSGSRSKKSIKQYAQTYKRTWENLLQDTVSQSSSILERNQTIVVPSTQLVVYLIAADQIELAREITEVMVSGIEGDIAHLPLTNLCWYEQPVSLADAALHLIYLHYKWPDRYARLQTAKQISTLLNDDSITAFRPLYLKYLSKQQYEVDITDFLSILLYVESPPFTKEDLIHNINYPSLVSDDVLFNLGYMTEERDDLSTLYSVFSNDLAPNKANFNKYANGMAPAYMLTIEKLEKTHRVPLVKHFLNEWEQVYTRQSCFIFNPHNFCSDRFYPQDKIGCSFSWSAETSILSAYVRTLACAIDQHAIPKEEILIHAEKLLPFSSIGMFLSPSEAPFGWPKIDLSIDEAPLPSQNELQQYLSEIANSKEVLLRADGPVITNNSDVYLDLRVILASIENSETRDIQDIFSSIDQVRNTEEGIFTLAKWAWPSFFGRWELDWPARGYFKPTYRIGDFPVKREIQNEYSIEFFVGNVSNGEWKYWVNQWYPSHPKGLGNSLGTYITVSKEFFSKFKEHSDGKFFLVSKMTCIDKRNFRNDQEPIETFGIIPI